jgi:hypothetical protein
MPARAGHDVHAVDCQPGRGPACVSIRRSILIVGAWTLAAFAVPLIAVVIFLGWLLADFGDKLRQAEQETTQVRELLARGGPAFAEVTANEYSGGWVVVGGSVATKQDYDRLLAGLTELFGPSHARTVSRDVAVRPATSAPSMPEGTRSTSPPDTVPATSQRPR